MVERKPGITRQVREFFQSLPPEGIAINTTTRLRAKKITDLGLDWSQESEPMSSANSYVTMEPDVDLSNIPKLLRGARELIQFGFDWAYIKSTETYQRTGIVDYPVIIVFRPVNKVNRQLFSEDILGPVKFPTVWLSPEPISSDRILGVIHLEHKLHGGNILSRKDLNSVMIQIRKFTDQGKEKRSPNSAGPQQRPQRQVEQ